MPRRRRQSKEWAPRVEGYPDAKQFGKAMTAIFDTEAVATMGDRELERLDMLIVDLGSLLGFTPEETERIRESL